MIATDNNNITSYIFSSSEITALLEQLCLEPTTIEQLHHAMSERGYNPQSWIPELVDMIRYREISPTFSVARTTGGSLDLQVTFTTTKAL